MQDFKGKVAVVTGAASGIGLELTKQLAAAGATVVASDIQIDTLEAEMSLLTKQGYEIDSVRTDVADTQSIHQLIDQTVEKHTRIDYLFNNAGIGGTGGEVRDLEPKHWEKILQVNLHSVISGSTRAYQHMIAQGSGHIVNTASAAGLLGSAQMIPYSTTKAAVVAFSRDFRIEAEAFGVKVTVLCPGFVESNIFENAEGHLVDVQKFKKSIPFKFMATEKAVSIILQGVLKNEAIIAFPGYVRFFWLFRRLFPNLADRLMGRLSIKNLRTARKKESLTS